MGKLASIVKENLATKFPADTEKNPKECMAVTLRSGKELETRLPKGSVLKDEGSQAIRDNKQVVKPRPPVIPGCISFPDNPPRYTPPLPYPQRFQKKGIDDQFKKFVDIFKKTHINIPFAEALEKIPNYVKSMKEILSKKKKIVR